MKYYKLKTISEMLDTTPDTLRRHIASGYLAAEMIGGQYKVSETALKEYCSIPHRESGQVRRRRTKRSCSVDYMADM